MCTRLDWGDGSEDKSICCTSVRIRVRIPSIHIKSQRWPPSPITRTLWEVETRGSLGTSFLFNCLFLSFVLVVVWMINVPHRHLNRRSLLGSCSLAGGSASLGAGFERLQTPDHFRFNLSTCGWGCSLSASCPALAASCLTYASLPGWALLSLEP